MVQHLKQIHKVVLEKLRKLKISCCEISLDQRCCGLL